MPYTITEQRKYEHSPEVVYAAAAEAVASLGGQKLAEDAAKQSMTVKFDKKVLGKVLGDRSHVEFTISADSDGNGVMDLTAYPLNAIGQKLNFGARKGVLRKLLTWFYGYVDHHLAS